MPKQKFNEIEKKTPQKTWKHVLHVLLGVLIAIVIGYFIFTAFRV